MRRFAAYIGRDECGFASSLQALLRTVECPLDILGTPDAFSYSGAFSALPVASRAKSLLTKAETLRFISRHLRKRIINVIEVLELALRYSTIVIGSGRTTTKSQAELWLYRMLRCRVICVFFGSDARPHFLNGAYPLHLTPEERESNLRAQQKLCALMSKHCNEIVAIPSVSHFFKRSIIDRDVLGWPALSAANVEVKAKTPYAASTNSCTKIVHAPSRAEIKGTDYVRSAIDKLIEEGYSIELRLLQNVSNSEVLDALRWCDFAIDQLWADVPGGVLAHEAMRLGVPIIVGSYQSQWLQRRYEHFRRPLPILCAPTGVRDEIRELVVSPAALLGAKQRAHEVKEFLASEHESSRLALTWQSLLTKQASSDWRLRDAVFNRDEIDTLFYGYGPPWRIVAQVDAYKDLIDAGNSGLSTFLAGEVDRVRSQLAQLIS